MTGLSNDIFRYFSSLIEKEIAIQYTSVNGHLLENRLRDLAKTLGHDSVEAFWTEVQTRGLRTAERDMILDLATNNETTFFRDPEVFEFFRNEFIPNSSSAKSTIKIWCAACSTGQEPLSLTITLAQLRDQGVVREFELLATDFSDRVLNQAKAGLYSQLEVQRGLPAAMLVRYFDQVAIEGSSLPRFKVKAELLRNTTFRRLNLIEPWPNLGQFDIIFCRNVLIYQDVESKKRVIARLANALNPGGYLVLGGAESLLGLSTDFEMQIFGKACVYKLIQSLKASA